MKTVPKRIITENKMTTDPMTLLIMAIPLTLKRPPILSTSQVSPYHHNSAPSGMQVKPTHVSKGREGWTKANCAKVAMKRNMIRGLEKVTRNAVNPLLSRDPLPLFFV